MIHLPSSILLASGDQAVEQGGGGHLRRTQLHQRIQVATIGNKYYLPTSRWLILWRAPTAGTSCTAQAKPGRRRSALCIATSASKIARRGTRRGRARWRSGTRRCWRRLPWGSKWLRNVFPLNSMVHIIYGQESVQQIVVRYEAPVCGNRWDAPLHLVLRDGQVDCQVNIFWVYRQTNRPFLLVFAIEISQAISDSLFHGKPVQPNMSTQNAPLAGHRTSWFPFLPLHSTPKRTWGFIFMFCREWFCSPAGLTMPGSDSGHKPFCKYPNIQSDLKTTANVFRAFWKVKRLEVVLAQRCLCLAQKKRCNKQLFFNQLHFCKTSNVFFLQEQMFQPATCFATNKITYWTTL